MVHGLGASVHFLAIFFPRPVAAGEIRRKQLCMLSTILNFYALFENY